MVKYMTFSERVKRGSGERSKTPATRSRSSRSASQKACQEAEQKQETPSRIRKFSGSALSCLCERLSYNLENNCDNCLHLYVLSDERCKLGSYCICFCNWFFKSSKKGKPYSPLIRGLHNGRMKRLSLKVRYCLEGYSME